MEPSKPQPTERGDNGVKNVPDISSEERFYNRSRRIRRKIRAWMEEQAERTFPTFESMADEAANFADCATPTARRWLRQFSARNGDFLISDKEGSFVISHRGRDD